MRQVVLAKYDGPCNILRDEISSLKVQKVKVFRTTVNAFNKTVEFVTTSKDVHLRLGQLGDEAKGQLAYLIIQEAQKGRNDDLLVFEDEARNGGLFASVIERAEGWFVINLSLAH